MSYLFTQLFAFLTSLFTKTFVQTAFKIAITLAFITLVVSAIYAYVSAAGLIIEGISQTVPDIVSGVWGWVMPSNTAACLLATTSALILRFATAQLRYIMSNKFKAAISK